MIDKSILSKFIKNGLNIIPVTNQKIPALKGWKKYQSEMVNLDEMPDYEAVAIVTGKVSGNLELIDIDQKYCLGGNLRDRYKQVVDDFAPGLWDKLVECSTKGGGYHLVYRCDEIGTNVKLASRASTDEELKIKKEKFKVLIETRAEGGYFLCKPTEGYDVVHNKLMNPPKITAKERDILMSAARSLDEVPLPLWESQSKPQFNSEGIPSWEAYDDDNHWLSLLQSEGWTIYKETDAKIFLKRPGAESKYSGNFDKRHRLMRIFSSSTEFDNTRSYTPSAIFTTLRCGGDFKQAARQLLEMGYGKVPEKNLKRKDEEVEFDDSREYMYDSSEDQNIIELARGRLELGLETGYKELDDFFRHKRGYFNILGSHANLGKSWFTWNLILAFCIHNNERYIIYSPENRTWSIKLNMIRFMYGKDITRLTDEQIKKGIKKIDEHICFIESDEILSLYDILDITNKLVSKKKYYGLLIDPYNNLGFDFSRSDRKLSTYEYHYESAREMKSWAKKNDMTILVTMHGVTDAQRKVHTEKDMKGLVKPLIAADLEWGGMWVNMCMDMIILHRYANHPEWKNQTQLHTVKIKEEWSGGKRTMHDSPVILTLNNGGKDFFGFWDEKGTNPFYSYAKNTNLVSTIEEKEQVNYSENIYKSEEEKQLEHSFAKGTVFQNREIPMYQEDDDEDDQPPF